MFFNGNAPVDYAFTGMFPRGVNPTERPLTFSELPRRWGLEKVKKEKQVGKFVHIFSHGHFLFLPGVLLPFTVAERNRGDGNNVPGDEYRFLLLF